MDRIRGSRTAWAVEMVWRSSCSWGSYRPRRRIGASGRRKEKRTGNKGRQGRRDGPADTII